MAGVYSVDNGCQNVLMYLNARQTVHARDHVSYSSLRHYVQWNSDIEYPWVPVGRGRGGGQLPSLLMLKSVFMMQNIGDLSQLGIVGSRCSRVAYC